MPENEKTIPFSPITSAAMAHTESAKTYISKLRGEKTVTMNFVVPVLLTLQDHTRIRFEIGPQEVPESLKDHSYLKANGVTLYDAKLVAAKAAAEAKAAGIPVISESAQKAVDYLVSKGETPEAAKATVEEEGFKSILAEMDREEKAAKKKADDLAKKNGGAAS